MNLHRAHPPEPAEVLELPPLILHPFTGNGTGDVLEGSLASMALQGIVNANDDEAALQLRVFAGLYQELLMLLFLGKDLFRWMQQCAEYQASQQEADKRIVEQSFSALAVEEPPEKVKRKLENWGVADRRTVFSRAIGVFSLFQSPPPMASLSPIFLRNYHRYADHSYICFQHLKAFLPLHAERFHFEIYASAEYASMLSEQWDRAGDDSAA